MWSELPETGSVPLVGDLSSVALGREYDINRFGLAYMGAQKNMGIAGLTVVIIRKELVTSELDEVVPSMLRYDLMAKNGSMYNTPPAFAIYMAGLVFNWVEAQGGVAEMERRNKEKAALLYSVLDESKLFAPRAEKEDVYKRQLYARRSFRADLSRLGILSGAAFHERVVIRDTRADRDLRRDAGRGAGHRPRREEMPAVPWPDAGARAAGVYF